MGMVSSSTQTVVAVVPAAGGVGVRSVAAQREDGFSGVVRGARQVFGGAGAMLHGIVAGSVRMLVGPPPATAPAVVPDLEAGEPGEHVVGAGIRHESAAAVGASIGAYVGALGGALAGFALPIAWGVQHITGETGPLNPEGDQNITAGVIAITCFGAPVPTGAVAGALGGALALGAVGATVGKMIDCCF